MVKDTRTYTVENLLASEVRRIGFGKWVRSKKLIEKMIVSGVWFFAWFIPFSFADTMPYWVLIVGGIPYLAVVVYILLSSDKAEKRFLKEVQEWNDVFKED